MFRMGKEEKDAVARVIDSGFLFKVNGGPLQETANFEKELREKFGCENALLMTSGQAALTSALIAMGIGPGDEVIVPAYTYIATAMAVVAAGAMPIICEVDDTLLIDPADAEAKITERTRAIIPVHMMGYTCNMDAILEVAARHDLLVLEDACQADGGRFHGKYLGTMGTAGALSFNYFKIISAGEGGALLTNDRKLFERALIYHDSSAIAYFGDQMKDFTTERFCGTEFRTNEITAAILREQLKKLDGILSDTRKNCALLQQALADTFRFRPSNDPEGDCGISLTLQFDTAEEAKKVFDNAPGVTIPYYAGKHVYYDWAPILQHRGAAHPAMNPFNMAANRAPDYTADMCPASLDVLIRSVHVPINPDWTEADIAARAQELIDAYMK